MKSYDTNSRQNYWKSAYGQSNLPSSDLDWKYWDLNLDSYNSKKPVVKDSMDFFQVNSNHWSKSYPFTSAYMKY